MNARPPLITKGQTAHAGLDAEDVVVDGEELLDEVVGASSHASLEPELNLGIVDAGEVAGAGGLVLLWVESEGVVVDTRVGVAGVVVEWLDLVEELAKLLLEAVLTVEDELELVERTDLETTSLGNGSRWSTLLSPCVELLITGKLDTRVWCTEAAYRYADKIRYENLRGTELSGADGSGSVGEDERRHGDVDVCDVGGEIPEGVGRSAWERRVLVDPGKLLDWVVEGEADCGSGGLSDVGWNGVTAGVLYLLNEVLVTLLREAAALLSVEEDVVSPDGWLSSAEVGGVVGGTVNVEANLVVLEGNEWKVETRVAVEEEDEWKIDDTLGVSGLVRRLWVGKGGHLVVLNLVLIGEVQLGVYTPPSLEVLVNALTTDGELNRREGTLGNPAGVSDGVIGGEEKAVGWGKLGIHVADEITVASNGDRNALVVASSTVDGLGNDFHSEVGVALVHRLEESNFRITGEVNILSTVQCSCSSCSATYTHLKI